MTGSASWAKSVTTMAELGGELKRRRVAAGFQSVPELLKNTKRGYPLPRSTAYALEGGSHKSNWAIIEAYLRACDALESEIEDWREAHRRALFNPRGQGEADMQRVSIPTAKQLAEMGTEEAARTMSEINMESAADLLRRIAVTLAAQLLPELQPSLALRLLADSAQARISLIFEKIETARGAELLAEMPTDGAICILDGLATSRAAGLIAVMPRGRAAKVLRAMEDDRIVRMLVAMPPKDAAALLPELDRNIVAHIALARVKSFADILENLDSATACMWLTEYLPAEKAFEIMAMMKEYPLSKLLGVMDEEMALTFLPTIPLPKVSRIAIMLSGSLQIEALATALSPAQAGAALLSWGSHWDDIDDLVITLSDMDPVRVAAIIQALDEHEGITLLAVMEISHRRRVLARLSPEEAKRIEHELLPENLARHIAEIPPHRSGNYLGLLDAPAGTILSAVPPNIAVEIISHAGEGSFDKMARLVEQVPPSYAARILQEMRSGDAAGVVRNMSEQFALRVLPAMASQPAQHIMTHIDEWAYPPIWSDPNLTPDATSVERAKRERLASSLRGCLPDNDTTSI
jgi:flagellar motility protein MotE (MotC chaperone)